MSRGIGVQYNLSIEQAEEALDMDDASTEQLSKPPVGEICLLSSPSIVLALEMQIGNETIPVIVMQASLSGQVKDWSSDVRFYFIVCYK